MKRKEFLTTFLVSLAGLGFSQNARVAPLKITEKEIKKRIVKILKDLYKDINWQKFKWTWSFVKDLGMDSLDTVEFIMTLEKEFDITVPDAQAERIVTLQQAVNYLVIALN